MNKFMLEQKMINQQTNNEWLEHWLIDIQSINQSSNKSINEQICLKKKNSCLNKGSNTKEKKNEEMKLKTLERKQIVQRSADADTKDV